MASTQVYATTLELRSQIEKDKNASDGVLDMLLAAASRAVDQYTNRIEDGYVAPAASVARDYVGSGNRFLMIDECIQIDSVAVKESPTDTTYTTWAATDWNAARGGPSNPKFYGTPYNLLVVSLGGSEAVFTSGRGSDATHLWPDSYYHEHDQQFREPTVRVTARWGYAATVPGPIKEATIMQAARMFERLKVGMADSLATTDLGELRFTKDLIRPPMME